MIENTKYKDINSKDTLYEIWNETILSITYTYDPELSDKYFFLLDEHYSSPIRPFSSWERVSSALHGLDRLDFHQSKLSLDSFDILTFASFFSYLCFDIASSNCFEEAAYMCSNIADELYFSTDENRMIFSLISSLDMPFVMDKEKSYKYHIFRDANYFWITDYHAKYAETIRKMQIESQLDPVSWAICRRNWLEEGLSSGILMHSESVYENKPRDGYFHMKAEDNFLDELTSYKGHSATSA